MAPLLPNVKKLSPKSRFSQHRFPELLDAVRYPPPQTGLAGAPRTGVVSPPPADHQSARLRGMLGEGDAGAMAAPDFTSDLEEEDDIGEGGAGGEDPHAWEDADYREPPCASFPMRCTSTRSLPSTCRPTRIRFTEDAGPGPDHVVQVA